MNLARRLAIAIATFIFASAALADIIDLGTLGGDRSVAVDINDSGHVVGEAELASGGAHAFLWTPTGGIIDLGHLGGLSGANSTAVDINASGEVAGNSDTTAGGWHAFFWPASGDLVDLGTLGGDWSIALAMNDNGMVVGSSENADGDIHAFYWTAADNMVDLGAMGGLESEAVAVNNKGQVVGNLRTAGFAPRAFSWTLGGGMVDLETLGGNQSYARDVNDSGQVLGESETATGASHAFRWTLGGGMLDLGTLGGQMNSYIEMGGNTINRFGQIAGYSEAANYYNHAFLWTSPTSMIDLGTLGNDNSRALALNNCGVVVGQYRVENMFDFEDRPFLWTSMWGMVDLDMLGGSVATPRAINSSGVVVGSALTVGDATEHAVMWLDREEPGWIGGLPDVNGNGFSDVAVEKMVGDNVHVQIRDGSTDVLISDIDFGTDPVVAMEVIDDTSGNGASEIAVLGTRPSGQVRVQIKDGLTGETSNTIFYGSVYKALDMAVVPDTNSNGAAELAVLGRNSSCGIRVQARDALDDAETSKTYFGSNVDPVDLQILPDIDGSGWPEVVVLARVRFSGQTRAQIKDTSSGALIRQVFFGAVYTPLQLAVVNDVSGDGFPDLAHLGLSMDTGSMRVQIKASSGGPVISNAFLGNTDSPVRLVSIGDANSNGYPDTAILVERPDGTGKVVIRDGLTGDHIRNTFMGSITSPVGLALVEDLDTSGDPELAGFGESVGVLRVQIRDSISGAQINNIDYP